MGLLTTSEATAQIANQVAGAKEHLQIVSAFCKTSTLKFIERNIHNPIKEKKLLVRFLLSDILSGASDFSLYEFCRTHGWQIYVRFDLHAKTYIFDRKRCILGSANLTAAGLGLHLYGNYEISCLMEMDDDDLEKIDSLFDDALRMTDELYSQMKDQYNSALQQDAGASGPLQWDSLIEQRFRPNISTLFTYDFPSLPLPDFQDLSCFEFLELTYLPTKAELREAFRWSKAFRWLYHFVHASPEKVRYFGAVTAALHSTFINDPKPYRKEVKELLSNCLSWVEYLDMEELKVDRPQHSQRISIKR